MWFAPPAVEFVQPLDQPTAEAAVAGLLSEMAEIRGFAASHPIRVQVLDHAGIRAIAEVELFRTTSADRLRIQEQVAVGLGVLPRGVDLLDVFLDLAEELVRGIYVTTDDESDAKEFAACFARYLKLTFPSAHLLERRGESVFYATGADGQDRRALRTEAWSAFEVGP